MRCSEFKKVFGLSFAGISIFAFVGMCYAASNAGRSAYSNVTGVTTARMPSIDVPSQGFRLEKSNNS